MPHVVLKGDIAMEDVFSRILPLFIRGEAGILKTAAAYIDRDRTSILVEALAVEADAKRSFLALIGKREDGVVVRIYPGSEVEKTPGVKRVLAEQAKQILAAFPALQIGETNLSDYLTSSPP